MGSFAGTQRDATERVCAAKRGVPRNAVHVKKWIAKACVKAITEGRVRNWKNRHMCAMYVADDESVRQTECTT